MNSSDCLDSSLWCGSWFNHVVIVNAVYPNQPGQEGPQSSNLSKLIFYASSKPQKLAKIGTYLEKRLRLDLRRYRVGYVRVTLQILSALIDQCHQHLNLFAKSVLRIVLEILGNPDPDLIVSSTSVFVLFSRYHDHTASADIELNDIYSHLVDKFCALATYLTSDHLIEHKMHLAGLKGIHSMVASDTFLSGSRAEQYAEKIIPSAMSNVYDPTESGEMSAVSPNSPGRTIPPSPGLGGPSPAAKRASITDDLITDSELEHIADDTLRDLFAKSNVASIKFLLPPVFQYLDEHEKWPSSVFVIHIIHVITNAVQPQHRYVPMQNMLERLQNQSATSSPEIQTSIVRSLTYLISAGGGSIGMTILELVEVLVGQLLSTTGTSHSTSSTHKADAEATLEQALIESVGSLATQVQYPDQVNEILAFLINRLKLELPTPLLPASGASPAGSSDVPITPVSNRQTAESLTIDSKTITSRKILLRCLQMVVHVRFAHVQAVSRDGGGGDASSQLSVRRLVPNVVRNPVDYVLIRPTLRLVNDGDVDIRLFAAEFLCSLFGLETVEASIGLSTTNSPKFLTDFNKAIYEYSLSSHNLPVDYIAISNLTCSSFKRFGAEHIIKAIPVLYKVQSTAYESKILSPSSQRSLGNIFIDALLTASDILGNLEIREYVVQLRSERMEAGQIQVGLDAGLEVAVTGSRKSFQDIENGLNLSPLTLLVAESTLNGILIRDNQIRKVGGVVEKLAVEYVPEDSDSLEPDKSVAGKNAKNRASVLGISSRTSGSTVTVVGAGARKAPSTNDSSEDDVGSPPIRVDDLKEALATPSSGARSELAELDISSMPMGETEDATAREVRQLLSSLQGTFESVSSKRSSRQLASVSESGDVNGNGMNGVNQVFRSRSLKYQKKSTSTATTSQNNTNSGVSSLSTPALDEPANASTATKQALIINSQPRPPVGVPEMADMLHLRKTPDFLSTRYIKNAASASSLRLREPSVGGFT
ncbi:hypothetical protein SmJEL517_g02605 [Synchytrium microbalum]|uniref:Protein EFR3 n=1 Tax=Synchytrium microbalum TaxID=1806994 RepID=A0A507CAA6_9FUNG|nr:uncharacterized protein SmJEL517_g02605 [Synchytrium microbalum]TPX34914.1 hypothetical protein SmJEL517_g02605 [Synchytrium microbalum]